MGDVDSNATSGVEVRGYRRGTLATDSWDQYVVPTKDRIESYRGRCGTFRQLGIAGTAGQKLLTIHNASGSTILVDVDSITVDVFQTAARVVAPPLVRLHRITTLPTGGTAVTKAPEDTALSSSASLTILQGTASEAGAATAITATAGAIIEQEVAPRALTLVGYEQADRVELIRGAPITLRALEGLLVNLDYSVATSNPVTDNWIVTAKWTEYTRP